MISLDDGKNEMAVVTDVTMGGASMNDGELEVMVHRRCQKDDSRGVQEPINETMCGCNDIGADPGKMGENGHEGDGGCDCQGLTMRGSAFVIFDTVQNAHKTRRELIETLNFAPTLAFTKAAAVKTPSMTAIAAELPANVKLMTISSNYKEWNDNKLILRLAHMYAVGEHATLSLPAKVDLSAVFAKQGLKLTSISETLLTANQPRAAWEAKKKVWPTEQMHYNTNIEGAQTEVVPLDESDPTMSITIRAMELKTCTHTRLFSTHLTRVYLSQPLIRSSPAHSARTPSPTHRICALARCRPCRVRLGICTHSSTCAPERRAHVKVRLAGYRIHGSPPRMMTASHWAPEKEKIVNEYISLCTTKPSHCSRHVMSRLVPYQPCSCHVCL
jgi:hypothetical protein